MLTPAEPISSEMVCLLLLFTILIGSAATKEHSNTDVPDNALLIISVNVNDVIDSFEKGIPDELNIPDLDVQSGTFVIKDGKLGRLKTLKKKGDVETSEMPSGSYKFKVTYTMADLNVTYEDFKYTYGWFTKTGKLMSSFKTDNSLALHLLVPPLGLAMDNYGNGECFIYVEELTFKTSKLTIDRVYTGGLTGGRATTWAMPRLSGGLEDDIQKGVQKALNENFVNFLPAHTRKLVCPAEDKPQWVKDSEMCSR